MHIYIIYIYTYNIVQGWFGDHSKGVYVSKHADYTFFYSNYRQLRARSHKRAAGTRCPGTRGGW